MALLAVSTAPVATTMTITIMFIAEALQTENMRIAARATTAELCPVHDGTHIGS